MDVYHRETFSTMKEFLRSLPKSSIATVAGAVIVYLQAKGYVGPEESMLAASVLAALGITVNVITRSK